MANEFTCAACNKKIKQAGWVLNGDSYYSCPNCKRVVHEECTVKEGWVFKDTKCPLCGFQLE